MSETVKATVLNAIAAGQPVRPIGHAKFRVGEAVVHVRFCSINSAARSKFKFNLNPNTLSADHEVWICGDAGTFYFLPHDAIVEMYEHPAAYVDRRHPKITVVSVDVVDNTATFATGGQKLDLRAFLNRTFDGAAA